MRFYPGILCDAPFVDVPVAIRPSLSMATIPIVSWFLISDVWFEYCCDRSLNRLELIGLYGPQDDDGSGAIWCQKFGWQLLLCQSWCWRFEFSVSSGSDLKPNLIANFVAALPTRSVCELCSRTFLATDMADLILCILATAPTFCVSLTWK